MAFSQEELDQITAAVKAALGGSAAAFDPETSTWPRPTEAEFLGGDKLPKPVAAWDLGAIYALARVGRLPDGSLGRGFDSLMAAYDERDRLEKSEVRYFADYCKPAPSWGAQQFLLFVGPGMAMPWDYKTPMGYFGAGVKVYAFSGYGLQNVALSSGAFVFGGGPSGQ